MFFNFINKYKKFYTIDILFILLLIIILLYYLFNNIKIIEGNKTSDEAEKEFGPQKKIKSNQANLYDKHSNIML